MFQLEEFIFGNKTFGGFDIRHTPNRSKVFEEQLKSVNVLVYSGTFTIYNYHPDGSAVVSTA